MLIQSTRPLIRTTLIQSAISVCQKPVPFFGNAKQLSIGLCNFYAIFEKFFKIQNLKFFRFLKTRPTCSPSTV